MPLGQVFKHSSKEVLQSAGDVIGNNAAGYMLVGGFIIAYTTQVLGMPKQEVLNVVTLSAVSWGFFTWMGGVLSDKSPSTTAPVPWPTT
ncbi:hypothetical protein [Luteococcus japonicus]|uniref:hypothetical protein n=1 Tax=Luteococcus japonicus TaxID=33984 RepID=UPI001C4E11E1|nr:hypothetical protein [Luteococcus japonicus]